MLIVVVAIRKFGVEKIFYSSTYNEKNVKSMR